LPFPEKKLIERIRRASQRGANRIVIRGIGDDCAVLRAPAARDLVITTDLSIEGVHFRRDWHSAHSAGHRCLARGLSDIAAMSAAPIAAFLSLGLPPKTPQKWVDGFLAGLLALARKYKVELAGGDTAGSPKAIVADITVIGSVPRGGAFLRSGAIPGDLIYVTGELGGSARAIDQLRIARSGKSLESRKENRSHFFPEPRITVAEKLRKVGLPTSMIDLSDGLSTDLGHICEESGLGAIIMTANLPIAKNATLVQALHGGEDYELLFTVPRTQRIPAKVAGVPITLIGEITRAKKMVLRDGSGSAKPLRALGWEHFHATKD
jgi:thiamine-monophosphate kinase